MTDRASRDPRVAALVPIRHLSERVPGKNYRSFCGRPLFHWVLDMLLACPAVNHIVVDTDSTIVKEQCAASFPSVTVIDRPQELCGGHVPMNEILLHDVQQVKADVFLQTHATNPLLRAETTNEACKLFLSSMSKHDSLFSVTRRHVRLWDSEFRPLNHDPKVLLRTQDLPPVYEENSCMYMFSRESIKRSGNRIGETPLLFDVDSLEAWDIDLEEDFVIGEKVFEVVRLGGRQG
jgi:CMP-N-acetylneuraminic acid synthetase